MLTIPAAYTDRLHDAASIIDDDPDIPPLLARLRTGRAVQVDGVELALVSRAIKVALMHLGDDDLLMAADSGDCVKIRRVAETIWWLAAFFERVDTALAESVLGEAEALTSQRD